MGIKIKDMSHIENGLICYEKSNSLDTYAKYNTGGIYTNRSTFNVRMLGESGTSNAGYMFGNSAFTPNDASKNYLTLGSASRRWGDIYSNQLNGHCIGTSNANNHASIPNIGDDGVMEIGKYIDYHYNDDPDCDYHVRTWSIGWRDFGVEGSIKNQGGVSPTLNAQHGWDVGGSTNRYHTLYCVNTNVSSDKTIKENICYLRTKKSNNSFREFIKSDLNLATYNFKANVDKKLTHNYDKAKRSKGCFSEEYKPNYRIETSKHDYQIGFLAQDIEKTEIGKMLIVKDDAGLLSYCPTSYTSIIAQALKEEIAFRDDEIIELKDRINKLEKLKTERKD